MPLVYIFDLDGVVYRGESVVEGAPQTLAALRAAGKALFFLTNNSTQSRAVYSEKLIRLGIPAAEGEIVTSASATADYLARIRGAKGKTIFAVGGPGIRHELEAAGLIVRTVADPDEGDAECAFVVAGLDLDFKYETLRRAQQILRSGGASFVATNRDGQYPVEGGVIPGGGSIVAAIEAASGVTPTTIGKPETAGLETILNRAGVWPGEAVMVGDRLDTDILCGNRLGVPTVLVLTGVSTRAEAESAPAELRPTRIIETLAEL